MATRSMFVLVLAAGCCARATSPSAASAPSSPSISADSASPAVLAVPAVPVPASVPSAPAAATDSLKLELVQVLSAALTSIALGEGSRIAVLADPPQIGDARGLHGLPLPNSLRAKPGEVDETRIFFGRDNEPRIMGFRRSSSGEIGIYWRHVARGSACASRGSSSVGFARRGTRGSSSAGALAMRGRVARAGRAPPAEFGGSLCASRG